MATPPSTGGTPADPATDLDPDAAPFVDANAVAGMLHEVFALDVTAAEGTCAGCGRTTHLGRARLYGRLPGVVLRCAACGHVLARLVATPRHLRFDLGGLTSVALARPVDAPA